MDEQRTSRYEYRVFDGDVSWLERQFEQRARCRPEASSTQIYFLTRLNIDTNLKIRNEKLELKTLEARDGLLERWLSVFREDLPVPAQLVSGKALPELGITLQLGRKGRLDIEDLVGIAERHRAFAPLVVNKKRRKYQLQEALAEIVQVSTGGGRRVESAAIESADADVANALIGDFGMMDLDNLSYPAFLQRWAFDH